MRIVINGMEITSPAVKAGIALSAILVSAMVTAAVVFILLPLIGITIGFSLALAAILILASFVGILALVLGSALFAAMMGPIELCVDKLRQRKR